MGSSPQSYGLSETQAPPPAGPEDGPSLERAESIHSYEGRDLYPYDSTSGQNELIAPGPIALEEHGRYLEDSGARPATSDDEKAEPPAAAVKVHRGMGDIAETLLWLVPFSIFGVLARLGMTALDTFPGSPTSGLPWVQFVGCVIMGALSETKDFFAVRHPRPLFGSNPLMQLYVGMTTGFCGSFTTFSSWMRTILLAMANVPASADTERPRGYSVLALLNTTILTLALSVSGIKFGAHAGLWVRSLFYQYRAHGDREARASVKEKIKAEQAVSGLRAAVPIGLQLAALVLGVGVWIGAVLMAVFETQWRGVALFATVFSPLGTLTRWLLSRYLNPLKPSFPLGTFAANMLGTLLLGLFAIGQQRVSGTSCQVLQGLIDGYCGCLTTVSTFGLELVTLKRKHAWRYGGTSVVVGIVIMVLTLGVDNWGFHAYVKPTC
ncbi:CrcB-like protein-domain-containing protein [Dipodascopsis tothii]|uniref:CrcB-like protein-domain-containing protein n=1 Tax=Dipodascopsis tothii TaxID=44089 RepID=UPI0034CE8E97